MEIKILKNVLIKNSAIGKDNRDLFWKHKIFTLNMISSPGAGKTTLLENSLAYFTKNYRTAVIEGDLYTAKDSERLQSHNIPIVQINTEGGCHLDARMISGALQNLKLEELDLIFIENVGNLVCPSSFDLGENLRVLILSVTEGADKPEKYANIFAGAEVILINKVDLAPLCKIDINTIISEIKKINPKAPIFPVTATDYNSLNDWNNWLDKAINNYRNATR